MIKRSQKTVPPSQRLCLKAFLPIEEDLESRVLNALSSDYWRNLNPTLSLGKAAPTRHAKDASFSSDSPNRYMHHLLQEGYFQTPVMLPQSLLRRMLKGIETVRNAGWPGVFAFLYDDFWTAFRHPILKRLLTANLGLPYRQLPYIWAHYVGPNSSGWPPHVDGGGRPKLSVWLPLTEATLDNGCIYVVRRNQKTDALAQSFAKRERYRYAELVTLMRNSRALPVPAGSFLGWGPELIHWGSASGETACPRISIAVEFTSDLASPPAKGLPFLDADSELPSFNTRLLVVARAVQLYENFEPALARSQILAEKIISQVGTAQ